MSNMMNPNYSTGMKDAKADEIGIDFEPVPFNNATSAEKLQAMINLRILTAMLMGLWSKLHYQSR